MHAPLLPGSVSGLSCAPPRCQDPSLPRTWSRAPLSRTGRPWYQVAATWKVSATLPQFRMRRRPSLLRPALRPRPPSGALPQSPLVHILVFSRLRQSFPEAAALGGTLGQGWGTNDTVDSPFEWLLCHAGEMLLQILRLVGLEQGLFPRSSHPCTPCTTLLQAMIH